MRKLNKMPKHHISLIFSCAVCVVGLQQRFVYGDQIHAHKEGAALAQELKNSMEGSHLLSEASARQAFKEYPQTIPTEKMSVDQLNTTRLTDSEAALRVKDQLSGNRMHLDPVTDPLCVNANKAILTPEETLKKQTLIVVDENDYVEHTCIETRDEEFEVINTADIHIHYDHFEVWQFYNHCPNHSGWGKHIAQGCITWNRPELMRPARNEAADYEETHTRWDVNAHPDFDALFKAGKCRLKSEMSKEEGREARMIPIHYYKKSETRADWEISRIDEHRPEQHRLKRPEEFNLDSYAKVQVYVCSYQSPGNTCKVLREQGGVEKRNTCVERMGNVCVKWQKVYAVPKEGSAKVHTTDISKGHQDPFNADGSMNDTRYDENKESAEAIARLTAVRDVGAALPKINTGDANALSVFSGEDLRCVRQGRNNRCPGGRGNKEAGDLALEQKFKEGKCIHIGKYDEKRSKNIGTMVGQKRTVTTYCCFDSVLAKILHQGSFDQGVKAKGSARSPNCGAMSLAQLQRLQWDQINFGPFVQEVTSKVNLTAGHVAAKSADTVRAHLENQMRGQQEQIRQRAEAR